MSDNKHKYDHENRDYIDGWGLALGLGIIGWFILYLIFAPLVAPIF